ncbi:MAG: hypothetical protein U0802_22450 [Candidatus Binatia bacterium]
MPFLEARRLDQAAGELAGRVLEHRTGVGKAARLPSGSRLRLASAMVARMAAGSPAVRAKSTCCDDRLRRQVETPVSKAQRAARQLALTRVRFDHADAGDTVAHLAAEGAGIHQHAPPIEPGMPSANSSGELPRVAGGARTSS